MSRSRTLLSLSLCSLVAVAATAGAKPPGKPNLEQGEFTNDRWSFARDWEEKRLAEAGRYGDALRFAECVNRFDAEVPAKVMARAVADPRQRDDLVRLAGRYRGCGMRAAVPALLVRAAFAELGVRRAAGGGRALASGSVGMPGRIGDFPVGGLAECQLRAEPGLAMAVLATRPGDTGEEQAVERLFGRTPQCSALASGWISPTAARLVIVEVAASRGL